MNHSSFECFSTPGAELIWDNHIQYCGLIDELTPDQRTCAKQAFEYLKQLLGDSFLKRAVRCGHPLAYFIVQNWSPWTRLWVISFAKAIRDLEGVENFQVLLKKLKARGKDAEQSSVEACSLVNIGDKFFDAGFTVSFEPKVIVSGPDPKKPDLKVVNPQTGEELFIEVSALQMSQAHAASRYSYNRLWRTILHGSFAAELEFRGAIHRTLSEEQLDDVERQIRKLFEEAKATRVLERLETDDLEVAIAPERMSGQLHNWAAERGIPPGLTGPRISFENELPRVVRKIRDKIKQLPSQKPGIIIVTANQSMLTYAYDTHELMAAVINAARSFPQLLCVLLTRQHMGPVNPLVGSESPATSVVIDKLVVDPLREQTLIVLNDAYNLSKDSFDRICSAFR